jgi:hypothetical protein
MNADVASDATGLELPMGESVGLTAESGVAF